MIDNIKTYGGLCDSFHPFILDALLIAEKSKSTPSYLTERAMLMHRAFDDWCATIGVAPLRRTKLYYEMKKSLPSLSEMYATQVRLIDFFNHALIPDAYLVRGKWTSREVVVTTSDPKEVL